MDDLSLYVSDKSKLTIHRDLHISFAKDPPNIWWRFWQWVMFGFKWTKL